MRWWEHWTLQDGAGDSGDGGGGGDPPVGDPPLEGDPPPAGLETIPRSALPEGLRDRSESEITFLLEHTITGLASRNNEVDQLKTELAELRGEVNAAPPPEPDPDDAKPLAELMLEDPEKALDRWARKKGYVPAMESLSNRVGEAEFGMIRTEIEGFADAETDVRELLTKSKIPATREGIMGAFQLVLGQEVLADRARAARDVSGSIPPSNPPAPDPEGDPPALSDLETEIMHGHGITDPAEWIKHRDTPLEVNLPT